MIGKWVAELDQLTPLLRDHEQTVGDLLARKRALKAAMADVNVRLGRAYELRDPVRQRVMELENLIAEAEGGPPTQGVRA